MTYRLTEEQVLLRDTIRQLAEERIAPRAAEIDRSGEFPEDIEDVKVTLSDDGLDLAHAGHLVDAVARQPGREDEQESEAENHSGSDGELHGGETPSRAGRWTPTTRAAPRTTP